MPVTSPTHSPSRLLFLKRRLLPWTRGRSAQCFPAFPLRPHRVAANANVNQTSVAQGSEDSRNVATDGQK